MRPGSSASIETINCNLGNHGSSHVYQAGDFYFAIGTANVDWQIWAERLNPPEVPMPPSAPNVRK